MVTQAFSTYDEAADFAGKSGTIERRGVVWVATHFDDDFVEPDNFGLPAEPIYETTVENVNENSFTHEEF